MKRRNAQENARTSPIVRSSLLSIAVLAGAVGGATRPTTSDVVARTPATAARGRIAQSCAATPTSLTPPGYARVLPVTHEPASAGLRLMQEIPLPGPANRFDYQSFDPATGRLWMNHMDAGRGLTTAPRDSVPGKPRSVPASTRLARVAADRSAASARDSPYARRSATH